MSEDIVERLRSNQALNVCPFDKLSPEYRTTPNDKPCKFCGGEPEGPDKCTGADLRILGEAAETITSLRRELAEARETLKTWHDARTATCAVGLQHPDYMDRLNALAEAEHSLVRALKQPEEGDGG